MTIQRRSDMEKVKIGGFDDGCYRYYDQRTEELVVKLIAGDCYVSTQKQEVIVTILGSCVAACIRDPQLGIGGMNHFLLPTTQEAGPFLNRYGVHAMEQLINSLLKEGASKARMEVKVFGGGNMLANMTDIGAMNIHFVKEFIRNEKLNMVAEDLGGTSPRRVHYYPETGKALVRKLKREEDRRVITHEYDYMLKLSNTRQTGEMELFT